MIRAFWRRLSSTVHPDDAALFAANPSHTFNLDFPPPAFVGDVDNAPVVVLMANGGYKDQITAGEFPDDASVAEYLAYLHGDTGRMPSTLSNYYSGNAIGDWLRDGTATMVNAVAYRSPKLSEEPHNRKLAAKLPSLLLHRTWVREIVLPAVHAGSRFLVVHRNGMWKISRKEEDRAVVFSRNPISATLARPLQDQIHTWLKARGH